jgi:hypothetical protein
MIRPIITLSIFGLLSLASIVLLNGAGSGTFWLCVIPQGVACMWVGWALRDWGWIVGALAGAPAILAIPFGLPDEVFTDGPPIVLFELLLFPAYLGLMVLGVAIGRRNGNHHPK